MSRALHPLRLICLFALAAKPEQLWGLRISPAPPGDTKK